MALRGPHQIGKLLFAGPLTFLQAQQCEPEIIWPPDYTVECGDDVDPDITGRPEVGTDCCAFTATNSNDLIFEISSGGLQVDRTWRVLDFCNEQEFEYKQRIDLPNPDGPCEEDNVFFFDTYNATDAEAGETIEILTDEIDEMITIDNGASFTLTNASGTTLFVTGLTLSNPGETTSLEGDNWSFGEVTFNAGWVEYYTDLFISRSFGSGDGTGAYPCEFCPPGEPIPGVSIALEQIPGGITFAGSGQDEEGNIYNLTTRLSGVNDDLETDGVPAAARGHLISRDEVGAVIGQIFYNVPAEVRPPLPPYYVPFVYDISFTDSEGNTTAGNIEEMDFNIPTTAIANRTDQLPISAAADMGTPVAGNIHPDGTATFYAGELIPDMTIVADEEVSSTGNNIARFTNVSPASPFVIFGCPGCGTGKVQICKVPPGNPSKSRTICVNQSDLVAHLNNGSYCGPCQGSNEAIARSDFPAVERPQWGNGLLAYPNPTSRQFTITFPETTSTARHLRLVDVNGRTVRKQIVSAEAVSAEMEVQGLPAGVYVLHVQDETWRKQVKVVVR